MVSGILSGSRPGDDIIVVGWIGLQGTSILAKEKEKELRERFSVSFLEKAQQFDHFLSILLDSRIFKEFEVSSVQTVIGGGIYRALWELAEQNGVGLDLELRSIPVRQETVEICEYFRINPYRLLSGGCILLTTPHGQALKRRLERDGVHASWIGNSVDGIAKRMTCGDRTIYLDRPKPDEIFKIWSEKDERENFDLYGTQ